MAILAQKWKTWIYFCSYRVQTKPKVFDNLDNVLQKENFQLLYNTSISNLHTHFDNEIIFKWRYTSR